jgi:(2Fe-2S) ferredoxin
MNETKDMYYRCHAFFCTNKREDGRACCQDHDAVELRAYAKQRIKELGLAGEGEVRINSAGCLDRCEDGPVIVIYPEGVWYTYRDEDDLDEIIEKHIIGGEIVEHLRI